MARRGKSGPSEANSRRVDVRHGCKVTSRLLPGCQVKMKDTRLSQEIYFDSLGDLHDPHSGQCVVGLDASAHRQLRLTVQILENAKIICTSLVRKYGLFCADHFAHARMTFSSAFSIPRLLGLLTGT